MATTYRKSAPSVKQKLLEESHEFDFFQATRLAERLYKSGNNRTYFAARFATRLSLQFPASAIYDSDEISSEGENLVEFIVNFMGLSGPQGVLPRHYTEEMIARWVRHKDRTAHDFLDIFNHRAILKFYQAWKKNNFWIHKEDKHSKQQYEHYLLDLVGMGTKGLQNRLNVNEEGFHDDALAFYSGLLSQQPRSALGLESILEDYFDCSARIEQCYGKWMTVPEKNKTYLGQKNSNIGQDAMIGSQFWDRQTRIRIYLGPMPYQQFVNFLPGTKKNKVLTQFIRFYLGRNIDFQLELILEKSDQPECALDSSNKSKVKLGWTSWIGDNESDLPQNNPVFAHNAGK